LLSDIVFHNADITDQLINDVIHVAEAAFGNAATQDWINGFGWRLSKMPDATIFTARASGQLVGFKNGYATAHTRYYSWLGAVHPDHRRKGIARSLMHAQHQWLRESRFRLLETQVSASNTAMQRLNISSGFTQSGQFLKSGETYLIMEKTFAV